MAQCLVAPPFRRRTGERRLAAKGSSQDGGCGCTSQIGR